MEDWQIAFIEQHELHWNILNDLEAGLCPEIISQKLAVLSYELRKACFGDQYTTSTVYKAYKKTKHIDNIQDRLKRLEEFRNLYQQKAADWEKFLIEYSIEKGSVYLLSNEYMPNLIKIGYTTKDVYERCDKLYYEGKPGVPYPFSVEYEQFTVCPRDSEKVIHEQLEEYRINPEREFFKISLNKAKYITRKVTYTTEKNLLKRFHKFFVR